MKLSMSMSSSKSTVRMYLISDPLGVSYVSPSGNGGFSEIKRIETFEPGPQYYRIASHYDTLRSFDGHALVMSMSRVGDSASTCICAHQAFNEFRRGSRETVSYLKVLT